MKSNWRGCVLVCGKCSKKVGGGFGPHGDVSLTKALAQHGGFGRKRKATFGLVETKCLGLCPKRAVVLIDTRTPDTWLVVTVGADVAVLADRLRAG